MGRDAIYELKMRKWKLSSILSPLVGQAYYLVSTIIIESYKYNINTLHKVSNWL